MCVYTPYVQLTSSALLQTQGSLLYLKGVLYTWKLHHINIVFFLRPGYEDYHLISILIFYS